MSRARRRLVLGAAAVLAGVVVVAAGCGAWVSGSGDLVTRDVDVGGVTRVEAGSSFTVTVAYGQSAAATITIDDNLVEFLEADVSGDTLRVGMEPGNAFTDETLKLAVTLPELRAVDLSGASEGRVQGFASDAPLEIVLSGASNLELADVRAGRTTVDASGASRLTGRLQAGGASFDLSGASKAVLAGAGGAVNIDASGASDVALGAFVVTAARAGHSGASHATVNVSGRLDVDLSGASGLRYIGQPRMGDIKTTGASSIERGD